MIYATYTSFVLPFNGTVFNGGYWKRKRSLRGMHKSGVYLIKENGSIVYVGVSEKCVLERCYRHFCPFNDSNTRSRSYYDVTNGNLYEITILHTSAADAHKVERGLILAIQPRDNRERYTYYIQGLLQQHAQVGGSMPIDIADELYGNKDFEILGVDCDICHGNAWKKVHAQEHIYECCSCGKTQHIASYQPKKAKHKNNIKPTTKQLF